MGIYLINLGWMSGMLGSVVQDLTFFGRVKAGGSKLFDKLKITHMSLRYLSLRLAHSARGDSKIGTACRRLN